MSETQRNPQLVLDTAEGLDEAALETYRRYWERQHETTVPDDNELLRT